MPARAPMSGTRRLGLYLHVPFCAARCGYCDFNTYVPSATAAPDTFLAAARAELAYARRELGERTVDTVFVGGGTPTLLGADGLLDLLAAVREHFSIAVDAEITAEGNPESTSPELFAALLRGGFTRMSIGMQSSSVGVLATLERQHSPGRAVAAAREARAAGFAHVSLDLIYGTPGESDTDWLDTLEAALSAGPDHVSAYALTVEPGTRLARTVARGGLPAPDDETQARRFRLADARLRAAGLCWYEISSWAASPEDRCRHNLRYWSSGDWWGIGPGAHSHIDGVRWSNARRPADYAARLAAGRSPAVEREVLTPAQRHLERVMLSLRTRDGLAADILAPEARTAVAAEIRAGRLVRRDDRLCLTREGRLMADAVTRALTA